MGNNIISLGFITVGQWLWKMLICFIYFIVTLYPIGLFYEAHFLGPLPKQRAATRFIVVCYFSKLIIFL